MSDLEAQKHDTGVALSGDELAEVEVLSVEIEAHIATAVFQSGAKLARIRDIYEYKRNGQGFAAHCVSRFGMNVRSAQRMISVYENLGEDGAVNFASLGKKALYALAAPSTPDEVRDEIEARVGNGEHIKATDIDDLKRHIANRDALADSQRTHIKKQDAELGRVDVQF